MIVERPPRSVLSAMRTFVSMLFVAARNNDDAVGTLTARVAQHRAVQFTARVKRRVSVFGSAQPAWQRPRAQDVSLVELNRQVGREGSPACAQVGIQFYAVRTRAAAAGIQPAGEMAFA